MACRAARTGPDPPPQGPGRGGRLRRRRPCQHTPGSPERAEVDPNAHGPQENERTNTWATDPLAVALKRISHSAGSGLSQAPPVLPTLGGVSMRICDFAWRRLAARQGTACRQAPRRAPRCNTLRSARDAIRRDATVREKPPPASPGFFPPPARAHAQYAPEGSRRVVRLRLCRMLADVSASLLW